ncbi:MAG TPA: hypothetical protein VFT43_05095 [Candidatus Polarisedimenticolia bacterium]|nr:hypothetical protein [Candidatus Polarisedimenticolia bacterium]
MRRRLRLAVHVLVITAVIGLLAAGLDSPAPGRTPYLSALSALSDVVATSARAAGGCEMKDCAGGSRHNIVCAKVNYPLTCTIYHGYCLGNTCP